MKKYITPIFEIQNVETKDIVLASLINFNVNIEQVGTETNASVSINDILGLR